jgi:hypothetical protein
MSSKLIIGWDIPGCCLKLYNKINICCILQLTVSYYEAFIYLPGRPVFSKIYNTLKDAQEFAETTAIANGYKFMPDHLKTLL